MEIYFRLADLLEDKHLSVKDLHEQWSMLSASGNVEEIKLSTLYTYSRANDARVPNLKTLSQLIKVLRFVLEEDIDVGDLFGYRDEDEIDSKVIKRITELFATNNYAKAFERIQQDLSNVDSSNLNLMQAKLLYFLARIETMRGNYSCAEKRYNQIIPLFEDYGFFEYLSESYLAKAKLFRRLGRSDEAMEAFQLALHALHQVKLKGSDFVQNPKVLEARIYRAKGDILKRTGLGHAAQSYFHIGLLALENAYCREAQIAIANIHNGIAIALLKDEEIEKALSSLRIALEISLVAGDKRNEAYTRLYLADAYRKTSTTMLVEGEKRAAIQRAHAQISKSIQILKDQQDCSGSGSAIYSQALIYLEDSRYAKAEQGLQQALEIFKGKGESNYLRGELNCHLVLAKLFLVQIKAQEGDIARSHYEHVYHHLGETQCRLMTHEKPILYSKTEAIELEKQLSSIFSSEIKANKKTIENYRAEQHFLVILAEFLYLCKVYQIDIIDSSISLLRLARYCCEKSLNLYKEARIFIVNNPRSEFELREEYGYTQNPRFNAQAHTMISKIGIYEARALKAHIGIDGTSKFIDLLQNASKHAERAAVYYGRINHEIGQAEAYGLQADNIELKLSFMDKADRLAWQNEAMYFQTAASRMTEAVWNDIDSYAVKPS